MSTTQTLVSGIVSRGPHRSSPAAEVRDVAQVVVDALVNSGVDLKVGPTLEEMKELLVSAFRSARKTSQFQAERVQAPSRLEPFEYSRQEATA